MRRTKQIDEAIGGRTKCNIGLLRFFLDAEASLSPNSTHSFPNTLSIFVSHTSVCFLHTCSQFQSPTQQKKIPNKSFKISLQIERELRCRSVVWRADNSSQSGDQDTIQKYYHRIS